MSISLLQDIKNTIAIHYPNNQQPMTQALRVTIIRGLLPFMPAIPHPASGQTLLRWQVLGYVASIDLTLVKWLESHLDAYSILQELGYEYLITQYPQALWAVWAAEGHPTPVTFTEQAKINDTVPIIQGYCDGVKTWCSGANVVDFAVMTYRVNSHTTMDNSSDNPAQLLVVDMRQSGIQTGIQIDTSQWQAVGMQPTDTASIHFSQTPVFAIGQPNAYLSRAGFWHGAAGVAACWYGATVAIAESLARQTEQKPNSFNAMYLGQVASQLAVTKQYFYHVASLIDHLADSGINQSNLQENPLADNSHELVIRQLRQQVEKTARNVLEQVGLSLGAAPFCRDAHFARLAADLPVFIRQTHGAFDAQAIGKQVIASPIQVDTLWQL